MHTHEIELVSDPETLRDVAAAAGWSASSDEEIVQVARCRLCGKIESARWTGPEGHGSIPGRDLTPADDP